MNLCTSVITYLGVTALFLITLVSHYPYLWIYILCLVFTLLQAILMQFLCIIYLEPLSWLIFIIGLLEMAVLLVLLFLFTGH